MGEAEEERAASMGVDDPGLVPGAGVEDRDSELVPRALVVGGDAGCEVVADRLAEGDCLTAPRDTFSGEVVRP